MYDRKQYIRDQKRLHRDLRERNRAQRDRIWTGVCGKKAYENQADALVIGDTVLKKARSEQDYLRVYYCEVCEGYHLTHMREEDYAYSVNRPRR